MTRTRTPATSRRFGQPGGSARGAYRTQRARLQRLSWRSRLSLLALISASGAVAAAMCHASPLTGAALGAAAGLALAAIIAVPQALAIIAVLAAMLVVAFPLGAGLTFAGSNGAYADMLGGGVALMTSALVATWFAVRYSRGKPWVTLAVAFGATIPGSIALIAVSPSFGLNAARIPMALVLLMRCGGWAWISGTVGLTIDRFRRREPGAAAARPATAEDQKALSAWLTRANAEQLTADTLMALPDGFTVFHDVTVKRSPSAVPHLVIGPAGVTILASVIADGPITETARDGVQIPGIPLATLTASLLQQRRLLARKLSLKENDVALGVVVHTVDGLTTGLRRALAVFDATSGELAAAHIVLLSPDMVNSELDTGFSVWTPIARNGAVRRARMHLKPALAPAPTKSTDLEQVHVSSVDADGHVRIPHIQEQDFTWMEPGLPVDVSTSVGVLTDLRIVAEPYRDKAGRLVVLVCVDEEWQNAQLHGRRPASHPYPVAGVLRPSRD